MSLNAYNIPLFFAKRKARQKKWDKCHLPKFFAYQIKEKAITVVIAFLLLYLDFDIAAVGFFLGNNDLVRDFCFQLADV